MSDALKKKVRRQIFIFKTVKSKCRISFSVNERSFRIPLIYERQKRTHTLADPCWEI